MTKGFADFKDTDELPEESEEITLIHRKRKKTKSCVSNLYKFPWFIWIITIADVSYFSFSIYYNGGFEPFDTNPMLGPSQQTLINLGAKVTPYIKEGEWWRLITPIFLHLGVIHLLINLWFQLGNGRELEKQLGHVAVIFVYFISGVGGNLTSAYFMQHYIGVGASSSLFGLVGMIFADMLKNWSNHERPIRRFITLIIMIAINFALGMLPIVDNFAHIGGFVFGVFSSFVFVPCIYWMETEENEYVSRYFTLKNCFFFWFGLLCLTGIALGLFELFYSGPNPNTFCPWCNWLNCPPIWSICKTNDNFPEG